MYTILLAFFLNHVEKIWFRKFVFNRGQENLHGKRDLVEEVKHMSMIKHQAGLFMQFFFVLRKKELREVNRPWWNMDPCSIQRCFMKAKITLHRYWNMISNNDLACTYLYILYRVDVEYVVWWSRKLSIYCRFQQSLWKWMKQWIPNPSTKV